MLGFWGGSLKTLSVIFSAIDCFRSLKIVGFCLSSLSDFNRGFFKMRFIEMSIA